MSSGNGDVKAATKKEKKGDGHKKCKKEQKQKKGHTKDKKEKEDKKEKKDKLEKKRRNIDDVALGLEELQDVSVQQQALQDKQQRYKA